MLKKAFDLIKGEQRVLRFLIVDDTASVVDLTGWTRIRLGFAGSDEEVPDAVLDSSTSGSAFDVSVGTGRIDITLSSAFTGSLPSENLKGELCINMGTEVMIPDRFAVGVKESIVL